MINVIIVGAGGFAREVLDWMKDTLDPRKFTFKGFLSNNSRDLDNFNSVHYPIIGDPEKYLPGKNDKFLLAIGDIKTRIRLAKILESKHAKFQTLIHPTTVISSSAVIGEGVIICPKVVVGHSACIKRLAIINVSSSIGHDANVGEYSVVSPLCSINGFANIGKGVFLGSNSHIAGRKKIGEFSSISAGISVKRNTKPDSFLFNEPPKIGILMRT